ncbi:PAS domain S-box protein [Leptospira sp. 201903070]|uniref:histidine kinase n=1 Tax=Leptospira ainlahdjerensis TaxID=2810033 RepID=A0ABS2UH62_9LEPT|nr:PAS domain S-box protein [Leptospira ainlahdjerensis]MBM9579727.1 PAS domain S-box protein [Leptospira ainlahdjerensis]
MNADPDEKKTILLVEDEPIIGMTEAMQLRNHGYNVINAMSGIKAFEILGDRQTEVDIVLMDIDLGRGIDGTEVASEILKEHDIPLLFLSSHVEPEIIQKTENITSYGYVVKSNDITILAASIKMAFRLHDSYMDVKFQKREVDSKKLELELMEKRYRRLFESAKDGILILDAETGMIVDVNPFLVEMLGYSKEQFLKKKIWDINAFKYIDYSKQLFKELQEKEYVRYTNLPLETIDGVLIQVEFVSNVYLVDGEKVIQCNIRDITDRNRHERSLTKDIQEKEALLKELQHRTKNSFQMITSLMHLRANSSDNKDTKIVLEELSLRVQSISDLYSLLYETDSFNLVQIREYCNRVIDSMLQLSDSVTIHKNIEESMMTAKDAATIGMILIELVSNSIKYAFPNQKKGNVSVVLRKDNSNMILIVKDDGIGFEKEPNVMNAKTLGLKLVNLMVTQLCGQILFDTSNGTQVTIEFPAAL